MHAAWRDEVRQDGSRESGERRVLSLVECVESTTSRVRGPPAKTTWSPLIATLLYILRLVYIVRARCDLFLGLYKPTETCAKNLRSHLGKRG